MEMKRYYPWFEEYCLAKPGAVKEPVSNSQAFNSLSGHEFFFMIGEKGLIGRESFVLQSRFHPPDIPPHLQDLRVYFLYKQQDGISVRRPFVDLRLTQASGDFFRHNFEEDIFPVYDPNNEGWNRICIDGYVPDDVLHRLIDMSYTIAFQSMPVQAREAIIGPEQICLDPQRRYCRLCSIFCARANQLKYPWLENYCLAKTDTTMHFNEKEQTVQFMVKCKMFAMQSRDETGRPVISLKLLSAESEVLRRQFRDIIPGYSMNQKRWNSIYLDGSVPDEVLRDMINKSYDIILELATRKKRQAVTG